MTPGRRDQIESLYHRALEKKESQRDEFLREACAGDDALRREVESLLGRDGSVGLTSAPTEERQQKHQQKLRQRREVPIPRRGLPIYRCPGAHPGGCTLSQHPMSPCLR